MHCWTIIIIIIIWAKCLSFREIHKWNVARTNWTGTHTYRRGTLFMVTSVVSGIKEGFALYYWAALQKCHNKSIAASPRSKTVSVPPGPCSPCAGCGSPPGRWADVDWSLWCSGWPGSLPNVPKKKMNEDKQNTGLLWSRSSLPRPNLKARCLTFQRAPMAWNIYVFS